MAEENWPHPGFIDSHAHLADPAFDGDRDAVIQSARGSGAEAIVCIGSGSGAGDTLGAAGVSRAIAVANPQFVWYTAGVHPHDASGFDAREDIEELRAHLGQGAVAVGECGLDYHYDNSPPEAQRRAFGAQLALAAETGTPVVVHTRDAVEDTQAMIREAAASGVSGVLHCFTGPASLAEAALEVGWHISFSGIVTFRKWTDDALIQLVPEDRLLAESDAPYLAPVPFRGKRNEPAFVAHTVDKLAQARGITAQAVGDIVSRNARALFRI